MEENHNKELYGRDYSLPYFFTPLYSSTYLFNAMFITLLSVLLSLTAMRSSAKRNSGVILSVKFTLFSFIFINPLCRYYIMLCNIIEVIIESFYYNAVQKSVGWCMFLKLFYYILKYKNTPSPSNALQFWRRGIFNYHIYIITIF